jgi:hypothetical protein
MLSLLQIKKLKLPKIKVKKNTLQNEDNAESPNVKHCKSENNLTKRSKNKLKEEVKYSNSVNALMPKQTKSISNLITIDNLLFLERRGILPEINDIKLANQKYLEIREPVVNWISDLANKFLLNKNTVCLAILILDKYISLIKPDNKIYLYAISSLRLASRKEEIKIIDARTYSQFCKSYIGDDIIQCEKDIFKMLNGDLNFPIYTEYLKIFCTSVPNKVYELSKYLLGKFFLSIFYLEYLPTVLISSICNIVCGLYNVDFINVFHIPLPIINYCTHDISLFITHNKMCFSHEINIPVKRFCNQTHYVLCNQTVRIINKNKIENYTTGFVHNKIEYINLSCDSVNESSINVVLNLCFRCG